MDSLVPAYVIGSGRSGTHFIHELFSRESGVAAVHEPMPMVEAFERYVEWNDLAVDHGAFLHAQRVEIARAAARGLRYIEASAYLSLSAKRLYDSFGARIVLVTRAPCAVVSSLLEKGWYRDELARDDVALAAGYAELGQSHHGFSRIVPRGAEAERWIGLTRAGKIAWYWRAVHARALAQLEQIPASHRMIVRLEDLDHDCYVQIARFVGITPSFRADAFEALHRERPGALPRADRALTAAERDEIAREVGAIAGALGYEGDGDADSEPAHVEAPRDREPARTPPPLRPRTLIATIGPSNWEPDAIRWMLDAGVLHFRINLARHSFERNRGLIEHLARAGAVVFVDLPGAKIRVGRFMNGPAQELAAAQHVRLVLAEDQPAADTIAISTPEFFGRVRTGMLVGFSGSPVIVQLAAVANHEAHAVILVGGLIGKFSGVWPDGPYQPYEQLWANDRDLLTTLRALPVDYVAVSFADSPALIREARSLLGDHARVVAKVESGAAIAAFDDLLTVADVVMIGRDDLSRQVPLHHVRQWLLRAHRQAIARSTPLIAASHYLKTTSTTGEVDEGEADEVRELLAAGMALCLADSGASPHWQALIRLGRQLVGAQR